MNVSDGHVRRDRAEQVVAAGRDEALVVHATATAGAEVRNTGAEDLSAHLFSGPDLHPEAALLGDGWAG